MTKALDYIRDNLKTLNQQRQQFEIDHGFDGKRPEHFKDCVVIRWPHRKRQGVGCTDNERIYEYVDFSHILFDKFDVWDEKHPLLDSDLLLLKAGILSFYSWRKRVWAIPNDNAEVKAYVLEHLPAWAEVTEKA